MYRYDLILAINQQYLNEYALVFDIYFDLYSVHTPVKITSFLAHISITVCSKYHQVAMRTFSGLNAIFVRHSYKFVEFSRKIPLDV